MTQAEWLACTDPEKMLDYLFDRPGRFDPPRRRNRLISDRKFNLFVVACFSSVREHMDEPIRQAVLVHERFADGLATEIDLLAARGEVGRPLWTFVLGPTTRSEQRQAQADLLRDLFKPQLPFLDRAWVIWNDGLVRKLAQAIYDDRGFDRLPILADALEEAGCTNQDILGHWRSEGEHVRGCWAVDLVLGKE